MSHTAEEFQNTLSTNINFFINLADGNRFLDAKTIHEVNKSDKKDDGRAKEFDDYITQVKELEKKLFQEYEEAERAHNNTVMDYLENFQSKISNAVSKIQNDKDNFDAVAVVDDIVAAAKPPATFLQRSTEHVVSAVAGFAGAIVGLICGAVMGMGYALEMLAPAGFGFLLAYMLSPPVALYASFFAAGVLGVGALLGSLSGTAQGASISYKATHEYFKTDIEHKTENVFKSKTFQGFFAKKPVTQPPAVAVDANAARQDEHQPQYVSVRA